MNPARLLLAAVMLFPERLAEVFGTITEGDFFDETHRRMWREIDRLHAGGRKVDYVTVGRELIDRGDFAGVLEIGNLLDPTAWPEDFVFDPARAAEWADSVRAMRRAMRRKAAAT